jgi:hypothetical protein
MVDGHRAGCDHAFNATAGRVQRLIRAVLVFREACRDQESVPERFPAAERAEARGMRRSPTALAVLVVCALVLLVGGCGGDDESRLPTTTVQTETDGEGGENENEPGETEKDRNENENGGNENEKGGNEREGDESEDEGGSE